MKYYLLILLYWKEIFNYYCFVINDGVNILVENFSCMQESGTKKEHLFLTTRAVDSDQFNSDSTILLTTFLYFSSRDWSMQRTDINFIKKHFSFLCLSKNYIFCWSTLAFNKNKFYHKIDIKINISVDFRESNVNHKWKIVLWLFGAESHQLKSWFILLHQCGSCLLSKPRRTTYQSLFQNWYISRLQYYLLTIQNIFLHSMKNIKKDVK